MSRTKTIDTDLLGRLARELREENSVISSRVVVPEARPALGEMVGAGPRASAAPEEYGLVIESIREGYLLHYGKPRLLVEPDSNLALLAGDYLYALGLERLAALADAEAVALLADLVATLADLQARTPVPEDAIEAFWLATTAALAVGIDSEYRLARRSLQGDPNVAAASLHTFAETASERAGLLSELWLCAESVAQ